MEFNWDNAVFRGLGKFVDCVGLSVLWLLCCIPVFTVGASSAALHYTAHKAVRQGRGYVARTFFGAFKDNFKTATLAYLLWFLVMLILCGDAWITYSVLLAGNGAGLFFYFFLVLVALALAWGLYLSAYIALFTDTLRASLKNAALLMLRHLPWSLLMLAVFAASAVVSWAVFAPVFILPAALALLYDVILGRIFRRYMSAEDLQQA